MLEPIYSPSQKGDWENIQLFWNLVENILFPIAILEYDILEISLFQNASCKI